MPKERGVNMRTRIDKDGVPSYEVRWRERIDGRTRQGSRTFRVLADAQRLKEEIHLRLGIVRRGRSVVGERLRKPASLPVAIAEYHAHLVKQCKPTSQYPYHCRKFLLDGSAAFGWTLTHQVGETQLHRLQSKYGHAKYHHYLAVEAWKRFLRYCHRCAYAVDRSFAKIKVFKPPTASMYAWTEEERERILAYLQQPLPASYHTPTRRGSPEHAHKLHLYAHWRACQSFFPAFWLMVHWAPRPLEACLLTVADFDPHARRLTIERGVAKNLCRRSFLLDDRTVTILRQAAGDRGPAEPLFLSFRGKRWDRGHMTRLMRRILDELRIPGMLYTARHHACTMLAQLLRGEIARAMEITGHKDLGEFKKYLHSIQDVGQAAEAWQAHLARTPIPFPIVRDDAAVHRR